MGASMTRKSSTLRRLAVLALGLGLLMLLGYQARQHIARLDNLEKSNANNVTKDDMNRHADELKGAIEGHAQQSRQQHAELRNELREDIRGIHERIDKIKDHTQ